MKSERGKFRLVLAFAALFAMLAFVIVGCASGAIVPEEEWNKTYGGAGRDYAQSVQQTSDKGYILAGRSNDDFWMVKTDNSGIDQWNRTFGGGHQDWAYSVQQTRDGDYILAGVTNSYGAGELDVWLIKTDSDGNELWNRTFGGPYGDMAYSAQQISDGGYILAGRTDSYGAGDFWLVKTDSNGTEQWNQTYGGRFGSDWATSVKQTTDSGYILAGLITKGSGLSDFWLVKTDSNGTEQWNQTFGGAKDDWALSVQQTSDSGYVLAGRTDSYGAGAGDFWLVKTDPNGTEQWNQTYGGTGFDAALSVQQTSDGGYVLAGRTESYGAGSDDAWLIKIKGEPTISIFDTEPSENPYPSIMGTHKGEIKPSDNINVSKLYTYPCAGTGGHTESIELYENGELIANGTWNGYQDDWHNITIHNVSGASYVMLYGGHEYSYTIVTGSYPQIIHEPSKEVTGGTITCTLFTDANGKTYTYWIPAIRLE